MRKLGTVRIWDLSTATNYLLNAIGALDNVTILLAPFLVASNNVGNCTETSLLIHASPLFPPLLTYSRLTSLSSFTQVLCLPGLFFRLCCCGLIDLFGDEPFFLIAL
jgi:hypothetical protein